MSWKQIYFERQKSLTTIRKDYILNYKKIKTIQE